MEVESLRADKAWLDSRVPLNVDVMHTARLLRGRRTARMPHSVTLMPILYVLSGLPATGKTTLAKLLSRRLRAAYLRIDIIEQALRDLAAVDVQGEGYELAYRIAEDTLHVGVEVVADCCNPIGITRTEWKQVAARAGCLCRNIEILCSDQFEHRRRAEARPATIQGLTPPTWEEIQTREYEPWEECRIVIDTAGQSEEDAFSELLRKLAYPLPD